jgi:hypothetical protein
MTLRALFAGGSSFDAFANNPPKCDADVRRKREEI